MVRLLLLLLALACAPVGVSAEAGAPLVEASRWPEAAQALRAAGQPEAAVAEALAKEGAPAGDAPAVDAARAQQLGRVAREMRVQPELAEAALAGTGLSPAEFQAALGVIARSPELSAAYVGAL